MSDEPYIIYSIMWQLNCNGIKINIWFYFFVFQGSIKCKALINPSASSLSDCWRVYKM